MKVAFFNDTYRPYMSGVITAMDRFAFALKKEEYSVLMVVPGQWTPPWRDEENENVHELPSIPVPGFDGLRICTPILGEGHLTIADKVDDDIDIVHAHSPFILGRIGAKLAEKRNIPLVFTCHSIYPQYSNYFPLVSELAADVLRDYMADYCSRCDLILAPSGYAKSKLLEWGVTRPIEVLPSGVQVKKIRQKKMEIAENEHAFKSSKYSSLGLSVDANLMLFVGRLDTQKNISFLFDVLKTLPGHDTELVVIGEGPAHQEMVQDAEEAGVGKNVHFTGKIAFEEVIEWLCVADVFCFPSVFETQGLVVVEAMAAGLPVVALDSPTSKELLTDQKEGFLTSDSAKCFARKVNQLLEDPILYNRMSVQAAKKAEEYSIEILTSRLIEFYTSVAKQKRQTTED